MATPFASRTNPKTLCLFDVDETLTPARKRISPEMLKTLAELRKKVVVGFVGGSDLPKITEQVVEPNGNVQEQFDYCFAENGLVAFKSGQALESQSFIKFIGEEKYKRLVRFILHYIADLDIPIKRGTFIEFRNGMINVSPIGRNASMQERKDYEKYDLEHNIRKDFVTKLKAEFGDFGLNFAIGGQISFDVFPDGWNKTYCLRHVQDEGFTEIHFFGDKTFQGGNDYEIFSDPRTIGHTVHSPEDTLKQLKELFKLP